MKTVIVVGGLSLLLVACSEKPQDMTSGKKPDAPGWEGAGNAYVVPGWKAGDKKAWEDQLKSRAQGQNEYVRTGGKS